MNSSKKEMSLEQEELKKNGDPMNMKAIPMPENGSKARSHAAHLGDTMHENTKPAGGLKHGVTLGELREPPSFTSRIGKEHKKM